LINGFTVTVHGHSNSIQRLMKGSRRRRGQHMNQDFEVNRTAVSPTLAIRLLRKLLTKNFHLSNSVCSTTTRKFVFGSVVAVCASTCSSYLDQRLILPLISRHPHPSPPASYPLSFDSWVEGGRISRKKLTKPPTPLPTLSSNAPGHGSTSGAERSLTHARVRACRSSVCSDGVGPETECRRSEISIL